MTKTKIVALLSIVALLASLPVTVALAQGAPYLVIGTAMVDDEPAMMGTMVEAMVGEGEDAMMVGTGEVFNEMGQYRLQITGGNVGDTVMISLMMGEGEEAMEYMAMTEGDVMIGEPGASPDEMVDLMAYSGEQPDPTAAPTVPPTVDVRGPRGIQGPAGPAGEAGPAGADGADGPAGDDGADGPAGADGTDGSDGADGSDGSDGADGVDGSKGSSGSAGPAGADGATGPAGTAGAAGADGGGGTLAIVALIIAIVGVVAAGGAFIAGRQSS